MHPPETWVTSIVGILAIGGILVRYLRRAVRAIIEFVDTMSNLRDLTQEFVKMVSEDERRFKRLEEHLGMPPWRDNEHA